MNPLSSFLIAQRNPQFLERKLELIMDRARKAIALYYLRNLTKDSERAVEVKKLYEEIKKKTLIEKIQSAVISHGQYRDRLTDLSRAVGAGDLKQAKEIAETLETLAGETITPTLKEITDDVKSRSEVRQELRTVAVPETQVSGVRSEVRSVELPDGTVVKLEVERARGSKFHQLVMTVEDPAVVEKTIPEAVMTTVKVRKTALEFLKVMESRLKAMVTRVSKQDQPFDKDQFISGYKQWVTELQKIPDKATWKPQTHYRSELRVMSQLEADPLNPKTFGLSPEMLAETHAKIAESKEQIAKIAHIHRLIEEKINIGVVFAMYNEKNRIRKKSDDNPTGEDFLRLKIAQLQDLFGPYSDVIDWKLILVDDGDPTRSGAIALDILGEEYPDLYDQDQVQVYFLDQEKGEDYAKASRKGGAILFGLKQLLKQNSDFLIYTDADLSTDLRQIGLLLKPLVVGQADITVDAAVGSRWHDDGVVHGRGWKARLSSFIYNQIVRALLPIGEIQDTQAGFKAFTRKAALAILPQARDIRFSFDTELLMLIKLEDFKIREVGIAWLESAEESNVDLSSDTFDMIRGVYRQNRRYHELKQAKARAKG